MIKSGGLLLLSLYFLASLVYSMSADESIPVPNLDGTMPETISETGETDPPLMGSEVLSDMTGDTNILDTAKQVEEEACDEKVDELKADMAKAVDKLEAGVQQIKKALNASADDQIISPYIPCNYKCCDTRMMTVNLHDSFPSSVPRVYNGMPGIVDVVEGPTPPIPTIATNPLADCSYTALLKVRFDKISPEPCPGLCMNGPYCRHRLLKLDLYFSRNGRSTGPRRMINIGDSDTNNGWGGDAGTHNYDAEIDGRAGSLLYYGNDHCNRTDPFTFPGALASNVYKMSMFVGNEYFRVINDRGFDQDLCSDCGFALNGQYDITLNQNEIYIALNRVVTGQDDRDGYGLCYLRATWACPYHYQCPWLPC